MSPRKIGIVSPVPARVSGNEQEEEDCFQNKELDDSIQGCNHRLTDSSGFYSGSVLNDDHADETNQTHLITAHDHRDVIHSLTIWDDDLVAEQEQNSWIAADRIRAKHLINDTDSISQSVGVVK